MLWFDNDPKTTLHEKIAGAVKYYETKYQRKPTLCYVNPSMLSNKADLTGNGIEIRLHKQIQPHNFWIGSKEETELDRNAVAESLFDNSVSSVFIED